MIGCIVYQYSIYVMCIIDALMYPILLNQWLNWYLVKAGFWSSQTLYEKGLVSMLER